MAVSTLVNALVATLDSQIESMTPAGEFDRARLDLLNLRAQILAANPSTGGGGGSGTSDATAANQTTGNNTLASILAKLITAPATESSNNAIRDRLPSALTSDRLKTESNIRKLTAADDVVTVANLLDVLGRLPSGLSNDRLKTESATAATLPATLTATIANAGSLSGSVDLAGKSLLSIEMPSAWTAANISFDVSNDNTTFVPLYLQGVEYTFATAASRGQSLDPTAFLGWRYLKVRSGISGTVVAQGAQRDLKLNTKAV